jgi:microcystin degradation protein MlrC
MKSFVQRMKDVEREPGVLSVSFGHGFPYGDVPEAGAKIWVVSDGDEPLAARWAATLVREVWAMREHTRARPSTLADALTRLQTVRRETPDAKPVVMADIADNAGGGASSDSSFVLRGLLERGIGNVALGAYWDLGALQICRDAGVGSTLDLRVGGKCGPASGDPVDLRVTVRAVREDHVQTVLGLSTFACGPSVWVSTADGIDLVLITIRQQVYGVDLFSGLGIDLASKAAIVVKSSQHFHAEFAPLASEVLYVDTPGLLRSDFEHMPYHQRDLNYWPRVDDPWRVA